MKQVCVILVSVVLAVFAGVGRAADTQGPGRTFETFTPTRGEKLPPAFEGIGIDERLKARLPLESTVVDDSGRAITLRDLFTRGKPVILQLGYFGCPKLCDQVAVSTINSISDLDLLMGRDFEVIYLSFDPTEKPDLARAKKKYYVQTYAGKKNLSAGQIEEATKAWHFLTADERTSKAIADSVGFRFKWVEAAKQYSHPAALIMITPEGTVSRYLYGASFDPKVLRLSLVDASAGKVGSVMDQIIMFCFHFDPNSGRYTLAAMRLMQLGGFITVVCLGAMTGLMVIRGRQLRGVRSNRPKRGLSAVMAGEGGGNGQVRDSGATGNNT
jgi:protein SCO1/2